MLEAMRKAATGILTKVLIGLLVLSFAVWGIADMITGVGSSTIASVGDEEISVYEFRQRYQEQVDLISARFGQRLTPQQARAFGVESVVLSNMIGERAVDTHAQELNLSITDDAVEESIRRDPSFQGLNGQFSPGRLEQIRIRLGMSEAQFIALRRTAMVRDQLTGSLLANVTVPEFFYDVQRTFNDEQRKVRYFTIDPKTAVQRPDTPGETVLRERYKANKSRFMTEETRDIAILMLTSADATKKIAVSQEQLKERYERDKARYSVPELRKVLQIPFPSVEAARTARAKIIGGKDFAAVAEANGVKKADMDLGEVTKDKLIDPKISDAAFKLKKDEVSDVIEGRFTAALIKVTDIKPGKVPQFEDIKQKIRDSITAAQAPSEIRKIHDLVDDNRLAGKSFEEIAALLEITFKLVTSVNRAGNGADSKPALSSPDLRKITSSAFTSSVNVENEVIELSDGGYAWTKVVKVTKPQQKPFEEVKDDIEKAWFEEQERKALTKLAQDYVKRLQDGADFKEVAAAAGGKVEVTQPFKRTYSMPHLSSTAVNRAFTLTKGVPAAANTADGKSRTIFEVVEIIPPGKATDEEKKQLEERLLQGLRADIVEQYVLALRNRLGVTQNQRLIDRTVGISAQTGG